MRFQVSVDGEPRPVELVFGSALDLRVLNRWRPPASVATRPGVWDTVEFVHLASKRWRYYRRTIATASSLENFKTIIVREPLAEVSFLMLVQANWFKPSPILGLAQGRRTYSHHFILEFLAVHPGIVGGASPRVRGVGSGLVCGLASFAGSLDVPLIWGEATAFSAP